MLTRYRLFTGLLLLVVGAAQAQPYSAQFRAAHTDTVRTASLDAVTGALVPCDGGTAAGYACENVDLLAFVPTYEMGGTAFTDVNDIWGWTDPDTGREIAIVGIETGTAFVDVTEPTMPVYLGFLPSRTDASLWRDVKVHADHAYVVSEARGHGMQVFDLTQLRSVGETPQLFGPTAVYTQFGNAHNIVVNEETGFAYAVGSSSCGGGLHMIDLAVPDAPAFAGCYANDGYTHDAQCVVYRGPDADYQGREVCANANEDTVTLVDVEDKENPELIARVGYPQSAYTHQGWFTADQRYYLMNDELDELYFGRNTRTRVWDVTDLDDPVLAATYTGPTTAIDHNLYVKGDYVYEANYTAGLRVLDASQPLALTEVAYFDTYPSSNSRTFSGAWSNYPYFESGTVVVSSIGEGLFVLRPNVAVEQTLAVTVAPQGTAAIPPTGGTLTYDLTVENLTSDAVVADIWVEISGPQGVGTLKGPKRVTIQGGGAIDVDIRQNVPAGAPAGTYVLAASAGTYPQAQASDRFTFEKAEGVSVPASIQDWGSTFDQVVTVRERDGELPGGIALEQNYPNPFNPVTRIRFSTPAPGTARLTVFDGLGRTVRVLVDETLPAGAHEVAFDAAGLPSGSYFYRLDAAGTSVTRQLTVLK